MEVSCVRCHVSGRVQGVWFRGATREQARSLGLKGYARNLSDGRVEVVACGGMEAIEKLVQWLSLGPPVARVTGVERCPVDAKLMEGLQDFEAR